MRRRDFIAILSGAAVAKPLVVSAQQLQVRRIAILMAIEPTDPQGLVFLQAFRTGLDEFGWREGRNLEIELRFAPRMDLLGPSAAELAGRRVELIVTHGTPAVQAIQKASDAVPIVFATIGDPIGTGIVTDLARPGGNVTGLSLLATDLSMKRLELLKEALPSSTRVAMLWNPANPSLALQFEGTRAAAQNLGLDLQSLPAGRTEDFEPAIRAAANARADAVITTSDSVQVSRRAEIVVIAARYRLPVMGEFVEIARAGALLSYGPSRQDLWRRSAGYVHKILNGTKPGELPVEQPTKFDLVINLNTAKALGLTIPPTLLARADEVIE